MAEDIEGAVKAKYGAVAVSGLSTAHAGVRAVAEAFGYSPAELASIPAEANMGLSCGNPTATANLKPGETVVDLGCVAGAIPVGEYRRGLVEAGFAHVEVVDTGADLNAYAKVENQSGCCSPAMAPANGLPVVADAGCRGPAAPASGSDLHGRLADL